MCGTHGKLVSGNICERTYTKVGKATFTPNSHMTHLQVLLVAGGGAGSTGNEGYSAAGGGGEVKVVGFDGDTTTQLKLVVGGSGGSSTAAEGATTYTADAGESDFYEEAGESGNDNPGWADTVSDGYGGGGGASVTGHGTPVNAFDGGAGATAASVAPSGSLFLNDKKCYGGGGASALPNTKAGVATCGGGYAKGVILLHNVAPKANTGGGGAGWYTSFSRGLDHEGASGVIVVRWNAPKH